MCIALFACSFIPKVNAAPLVKVQISGEGIYFSNPASNKDKQFIILYPQGNTHTYGLTTFAYKAPKGDLYVTTVDQQEYSLYAGSTAAIGNSPATWTFNGDVSYYMPNFNGDTEDLNLSSATYIDNTLSNPDGNYTGGKISYTSGSPIETGTQSYSIDNFKVTITGPWGKDGDIMTANCTWSGTLIVK